MIEQKYILDDCSAREGHRVFEALGITKMHNSESGKVKMSIEQTEKYIKKVEKYISHEVEEHWVRAWVYCICGWRGLDGMVIIGHKSSQSTFGANKMLLTYVNTFCRKKFIFNQGGSQKIKMEI